MWSPPPYSLMQVFEDYTLYCRLSSSCIPVTYDVMDGVGLNEPYKCGFPNPRIHVPFSQPGQ